MKKKAGALLLVILFSGLLVFLDQITKLWAGRALMGAEDIILIPGVFQLHYLENHGMAFGLLQNQRSFFIVVTVIFFAAAAAVTWRTPAVKRYLPVYAVIILLTAGAAGNFIDRLLNGYVVDFLYFSLIDFPVFNVADIFVTCGSVILILLLIFFYKDDELERIYGRKRK